MTMIPEAPKPRGRGRGKGGAEPLAETNVSDRPEIAANPPDVDRVPTTEAQPPPPTEYVETPEERAALKTYDRQAENDGGFVDDPALHETYKGAMPFEPIVDSYEDPDTDASAMIARARSGAVTAQRQPQRMFEAPAPENYAQPSAMLPGERPDEPVGAVVETGNRVRISSAEFVQEMDEIDTMIGSNRRRLSVSFDWSRERVRQERHVYTRHYYDRGVLVDRFALVDKRTQLEAADKAATIEAYNASVDDPRQRVGYLALLAEAVPTEDDVRRVLNRGVAITFPVGELPERPVVGKEVDNKAQLAVPRGSVQIGTKTIRGMEIALYHDAMKGVFTGFVGNEKLVARSMVELDALAQEAITKQREVSAAIDETVRV